MYSFKGFCLEAGVCILFLLSTAHVLRFSEQYTDKNLYGKKTSEATKCITYTIHRQETLGSPTEESRFL